VKFVPHQREPNSRFDILTGHMATVITTSERETSLGTACHSTHVSLQRMINYTDHLTRLMSDIVVRVPALGHIDMSRVLVFARFGRSDAQGAYATCHAISLPSSEPSYYFWRDRRTGEMTRRSEWFVTKSPQVELGSSTIDYLISFCLPRFCDQTIARAQKESSYPRFEPWVAKLDTIVHELYHIDPTHQGIRRLPGANGRSSTRSHSPEFFRDVVMMTKQYLATRPDRDVVDFLKHDFVGLERLYGRVTGTTFRTFPSYPQRYVEVVADQPVVEPGVRVEPVRKAAVPTRYTSEDLDVREFSRRASRRMQPSVAA
jgi:hypothetical protein